MVGWSRVADSPEMLETIKKNKRSSLGLALVLTLLFPIGFLVAGLFSDEMPLNEAIIIGAVLGLLVLIINLWRFANMKQRAWNGVVVKKLEKRRYENNENTSPSYMEYIVLIKTDQGKTKRIAGRKWDRDMYDYLDIGDRVLSSRPGDNEKYDKSKDEVIYCNVCREEPDW